MTRIHLLELQLKGHAEAQRSQRWSSNMHKLPLILSLSSISEN